MILKELIKNYYYRKYLNKENTYNTCKPNLVCKKHIPNRPLTKCNKQKDATNNNYNRGGHNKTWITTTIGQNYFKRVLKRCAMEILDSIGEVSCKCPSWRCVCDCVSRKKRCVFFHSYLSGFMRVRFLCWRLIYLPKQ